MQQSEECFQRVIFLWLPGSGGAWGSCFHCFHSCCPMQLNWKAKRIISSSGNQVGMSWLFLCLTVINEKDIFSNCICALVGNKLERKNRLCVLIMQHTLGFYSCLIVTSFSDACYPLEFSYSRQLKLGFVWLHLLLLCQIFHFCVMYL